MGSPMDFHSLLLSSSCAGGGALSRQSPRDLCGVGQEPKPKRFPRGLGAPALPLLVLASGTCKCTQRKQKREGKGTSSLARCPVR